MQLLLIVFVAFAAAFVPLLGHGWQRGDTPLTPVDPDIRIALAGRGARARSARQLRRSTTASPRSSWSAAQDSRPA